MPVGDEKLERAVNQGAVLARELGRLPKMADWKEARRTNKTLMSEWQVYRLVDIDAGPWAAFQFLVRERLREEGVAVSHRTARRSRCGESTLGRGLPHLASQVSGAAPYAASTASFARHDAPSCGERTDGQQPVVAIGAVGAEPRLGHDPATLEVEQPPLGDLVLAQREPERAFDDLECRLRRREEHLAPRTADPERSGNAAGKVQPAREALVDPRGRHRASQLLERRVIGSCELHQGEDRLGVDRHVGLGALDRVLGEDLLVVRR